MHGGVKVYHGHASGARRYLEADCALADDYYLTEGTRLAQRYAADAEGHVVALAALEGEGYEAWVAGIDPDTGEPKGRLRTDERAVRFVEVTVNGPKSWSLAAELHPDIAAAYEAAQDRAATQVIGWLGQHATARVGPRGAQVAVPVEKLEAVTVRHYTSRAGDPHRHLHLQVNARVWAAGAWRGLDTVALRDSIAAVNGIGHAAVATDPGFRGALAQHGYTLSQSGEITQLAPYIGAFSKRAAQIDRNITRYEKAWRAEHPGQEPGRALRRSWDARAWADARPDKVVPVSGQQLHERWLTELTELGYRDVGQPMLLLAPAVGGLDRDHAVQIVVARVGAVRSAWNAADLRGEVEQLLARTGLVAEPAVRLELAEDLTGRALAACVPLLDRPGVPDHVRGLTSHQVLAVEDDLVGRLAVRGAEPEYNLPASAVPVTVAAAVHQTVGPSGIALDAGQAAAVAALAGGRALVLVEGAAGAGKTTLLAATRNHLDQQGRRLVVVTPTLKAAQAASAELGASASSAAKLAHAHGWRWNRDGVWTRLAVGDLDPKTGRPSGGPGEAFRLGAGDLLLCDEAGMLDQDTARALLVIADEHGARVAFVGDRHQLAAVGRGGVLDHAARWADPAAQVTVDVVHRFARVTTDEHGPQRTVPDREYADLTGAMRTGADPERVFDSLHRRGQIQVHADAAELHDAIAANVVADRLAGRQIAVVAGTREQVAELNTVIRDAMITAGLVTDDAADVVMTRAGERIGRGDVVATRRNDRTLDVANRDTWTVTATIGDGGLRVTGPNGARHLPAAYVSADVELAYATTVHGAQGSTVTSAHLVLDEQSTAAGAYVGMTRGRLANTAHLTATDHDAAREHWVAVFGRDRADLGPAAAHQAAERDAARYALAQPAPERPQPEPVAPPVVEPVVDAQEVKARLWLIRHELWQAWNAEAIQADRLERALQLRDDLRGAARVRAAAEATIGPLTAAYDTARAAAARADTAAAASAAAIAAETDRTRDALIADWEAQLPAARAAARTVQRGAGPLGLRLPAVNRSSEELARWAVRWQPVLPTMPTRHDEIALHATTHHYPPSIHRQVENYAHRQAHAHHPNHDSLTAAAEHAHDAVDQAGRHLHDAENQRYQQLAYYGAHGQTPDPAHQLVHVEALIPGKQTELASTRDHIQQLEHALTQTTHQRNPGKKTAAPADPVVTERARWQADRDASQHAREAAYWAVATRGIDLSTDNDYEPYTRHPGHDRGGPSISR